jgi:hypothetical protein
MTEKPATPDPAGAPAGEETKSQTKSVHYAAAPRTSNSFGGLFAIDWNEINSGRSILWQPGDNLTIH